ncbi:MAG: L,D-transpeptidase family protein [Woeseiaceae bacterium]|nr:L,D-transpeptidase family protein [Woeseiaceae bacterium]
MLPANPCHSRVPARLLAGLAALSLAGCGTLEGFLDNPSRPAHGETTEAAGALPRAEPQSRNDFVLDDPQQSVVGDLQVVIVGDGQTFSSLAREYGLGYDELLAANPGVDPWIPAPGTAVLLPTQYVLPATPRAGVVLNIATKRLFYYPESPDGEPQPVLTYPIGIGRVGWETPLGSTRVTAKARDPHWYVPTSVRQEHAEAGDPLPAVVPPGPDNPLGRYVLKLGLPGYLIHGTNQPYGVGMRVSHGCVRLYPENIEALYPLVGIDEQVTIVNQPHLLGVRGEQVYFESHAPLEDNAVDTAQHLEALVTSAGDSGLIDGNPAAAAARMRAIASESLGVPVLLMRSDSDEIFDRALLVRNTVEADPDAPTLSEVRELLDAPVQPVAGDVEAVN